jgi:hypothetical protein
MAICPQCKQTISVIFWADATHYFCSFDCASKAGAAHTATLVKEHVGKHYPAEDAAKIVAAPDGQLLGPMITPEAAFESWCFSMYDEPSELFVGFQDFNPWHADDEVRPDVVTG